MKKFKVLPPEIQTKIVNEVKLMLAAHRDSLWTRWKSHVNTAVDPTRYAIIPSEGYYGEAFGIMRGLNCLGYGYFGSSTLSAVQEKRSAVPNHNLKWWFETLQQEYLEQEGYFDGTTTEEKCRSLLEEYRILVRK